jgi:hypothetical protein
VPADDACCVERCSVSGFVSTLAIAPTSVTSKPSRIHVIPSAIATYQCQRLHGRRSSCRGIIVSTTSPVEPGALVLIAASIAMRLAPGLARIRTTGVRVIEP